jgi:hypothetical protein
LLSSLALWEVLTISIFLSLEACFFVSFIIGNTIAFDIRKSSEIRSKKQG